MSFAIIRYNLSLLYHVQKQHMIDIRRLSNA